MTPSSIVNAIEQDLVDFVLEGPFPLFGAYRDADKEYGGVSIHAFLEWIDVLLARRVLRLHEDRDDRRPRWLDSVPPELEADYTAVKDELPGILYDPYGYLLYEGPCAEHREPDWEVEVDLAAGRFTASGPSDIVPADVRTRLILFAPRHFVELRRTTEAGTTRIEGVILDEEGERGA